MARPSCPLCRDPFSVVRVRALARVEPSVSDTWWRPPPATPARGRWILGGLLAGFLLFAVTGFTLVWLALALVGGLVLELYEGCEHADAARAARQIRAVWDAAYFCPTHDVVFAADLSWVCPPESFAHELQAAARGTPRPAPRYQESQSHSS
jgi:hypothetical protein